MWPERFERKHWIFGLALPCVLIFDQLTKAVVERRVPLHESIAVIRGFFNITHVKNTGAAFGLFAGYANAFRSAFFIAITIGAVILILVIFRRIKKDRVLVPLSLAMFTAGAIGNLVDRIRWGHVIDFLDVHWGVYHWPAFNVADSAITLGILLLLVENLFFNRGKPVAEDVPQNA